MFPSQIFKNKNILVGVTGGIAAYKTCELVRYLTTQEASVRVMMSEAGTRFVSPLTFATLTRNPVQWQMFPEGEFHATHHIHLADWAEAVIIAPATANFIGKISGGIADDFITTTTLAVHCPVVIAPAMNVHMWQNPAVQENVEKLMEFGYLICPPEEGFLAEGYSGMGRLARLEHLIQYLYKALHPHQSSLDGKKVLITAGRTEEPLDPVRVLTNYSSGKMGFALAWEAFARGAEVTLVHGPTDLPVPVGVQAIRVRTAQEMLEAVKERFKQADYFFSAAAVADFRPEQMAEEKIKKDAATLELRLIKNPDILGEMSRQKKSHQCLVGFAVETEAEEVHAEEKMKRKNLDFIVVNNPRKQGAGFGVDTNQVILLSKAGERKETAVLPKLDIAREIFDFVLTQQSRQ